MKIYNYYGQVLRTYNFSQVAYTNGNFSPDGNKFVHYSGSAYIYDFSNNIDTEIPITGSTHDFLWSPDTQYLFFLQHTNSPKLYRINGDGSGNKLLISENIYQIDWSIIN